MRTQDVQYTLCTLYSLRRQSPPQYSMAIILKTAMMLSLIVTLFRHTRGENVMLPCGSCLCNKERTSADCSDKDLLVVPKDLPSNIVHLDISHNRIGNLYYLQSYRSLVEVDASHNDIKILDRDDFLQLSNLAVLDLHHNHLSLSNASYPKGLFRHQWNLSKLIIHSNSEVEGNDLEYPGETFSSLISLEHLSIDGLRNAVFGQGFQSLENLTSLKLGGNCNIRTLQNDTFKFMSSIKYLTIKSCVVTNIEPTAFQPMRKILELDISNNVDLGMHRFGIGISGLQNSTIKKLFANRLNTYHGTGILLKTEHIHYLGYTQLEELHFDDNRIEDMDPDLFLHLPRSLKKLSVKGNKFVFGLYILETSALTGLEWLDSSWQDKSHVQPFSLKKRLFVSDKRHKELKRIKRDNFGNPARTEVKQFDFLNSWPGNFTIYGPPNVTFLNASRSKHSFTIPRIEFGPNKLKTLDLSYNFFSRWEGPIVGLNSLEYVDVSHNYCDYISDVFLQYVSALKFIDFSYNYLGYSLSEKTFKNLTNLQIIDLSNNKINKLPIRFLDDLAHLKHINLSSNYMASFNLNIENMANLSILDISNNMFEEFPENLKSQLSKWRNSHLKVNINNNPFKCSCRTMSSLKWITKRGTGVIDIHNTSCTFPDGTKKDLKNLHEVLVQLEKSCASYVGIMFGVLSLVLLVLGILISGLAYRYRWKLRYLYYLMLNRHRGYLPAQDEEHNFEFEAFISYADEDRSFVVRDMRRVLEEPEAPEERFRLCIHHRDFLAGEAIAANILKAINTSRKTVVILTKNFLKSYWCRYEVEMAKMESIYRGRNTLLIVVMEDIPVKDLPADIVEQMRKDSYIEFTNDREGQLVFWQNMKRAIRN